MSTNTPSRPPYGQLEQQVCDLVADVLWLPRSRVQPATRLIEDLHVYSLDIVELMLEIEDRFAVSLPDAANDRSTSACSRGRSFACAISPSWCTCDGGPDSLSGAGCFVDARRCLLCP